MLNKETKQLIKLVRERMKYYYENVDDDSIRYKLYRKLYTKYIIEGGLPYNAKLIDMLIRHDYYSDIDVIPEDWYCIDFLNENFKNKIKYYYGSLEQKDDEEYLIEILVKKDKDYLVRYLF